MSYSSPYEHSEEKEQHPMAYFCSSNDNPPPSMLFTMLPSMIQTRLPKLNSFRHSVNELRYRTGRITSASPAASGTSTPRTSCSSQTGTLVEPGLSSIPAPSCDGESVREEFPAYERPSSAGSSTLPVFPMSEVESGINWKYANHGSNLLAQAFQESSAFNALTDGRTPTFCRDLYIHALAYLLRALPSDLCQSEVMTLKASIPASVVESIEANVPRELVPYHNGTNGAGPNDPEPSLVHKAIAAIILQVFIAVQFILPYVKIFIAATYRYEREHRISERVFSKSIDTIDELGRRSLIVADRVCAMNDGKVGQAINDLTIWWVKGVTGGIHQGFREGVVVLREEGRRRNNEVEDRGKVVEKIE